MHLRDPVTTNATENDALRHTCAAFPSGIMPEVLRDTFDHRKRHYLDDGATLYEPRNNDAKRAQAALFEKGETQ